MKAMFPKTSDLALDLLEKLLAFNPVKRITVEEALRHPYLEPYHDPEDEPTADAIPEEFFDFDKNKETLTKEELKSEFNFPTFLSTLSRVADIECSSYLQRDHAVILLIHTCPPSRGPQDNPIANLSQSTWIGEGLRSEVR